MSFGSDWNYTICKECGSRQSKQEGGIYDDSKQKVMIFVCPKCGRKCPDCGGIQEWEDIGEMFIGQGSVGFTWICTECGAAEYNKEMTEVREWRDYEPPRGLVFLLKGIFKFVKFLPLLLGLVFLLIPFFFGYHLFYGDWKNEDAWNILAGMSLVFSMFSGITGLAIIKKWLGYN